MDRRVSGYEVDQDALADALRGLADGLDAGEVYLTDAGAGQAATLDTMARGTLDLTYAVDRSHADLLYPVQFDTEDTNE